MLKTLLLLCLAAGIVAVAAAQETKPLVQGYHQRLLVKNFAAEFRFFRDVLGFKPTFGAENDNYADFEIAKGKWFAIFSRQVMANAVNAGKKAMEADAQDRFALIFSVKDVDAAYAELRKRGVKFIAEPTDHKDWGIRTAHFRDPDGNLIEINGELLNKN